MLEKKKKKKNPWKNKTNEKHYFYVYKVWKLIQNSQVCFNRLQISTVSVGQINK